MESQSKLVRDILELKALRCSDKVISEVLGFDDSNLIDLLTEGKDFNKDTFRLNRIFLQPKYRKDRETELLLVLAKVLQNEESLSQTQMLALFYELEVNKVKTTLVYYTHTLHLAAAQLPERVQRWLVLIDAVVVTAESLSSTGKVLSDIFHFLRYPATLDGTPRKHTTPEVFPERKHLWEELVMDYAVHFPDNLNIWSVVNQWYECVLDHLDILKNENICALFESWLQEMVPKKESREAIILYYGLQEAGRPMDIETLAKQLEYKSANGTLLLIKARQTLRNALWPMKQKNSHKRLHEILFQLPQEQDAPICASIFSDAGFSQKTASILAQHLKVEKLEEIAHLSDEALTSTKNIGRRSVAEIQMYRQKLLQNSSLN